jgi:hypothetical protein
VIISILILALAAAPSKTRHIFPTPLDASPLNCYLFVFDDALQVKRLPMSKLLAEAKYRPINVPVDFFIDPLIKPDPGTGEVTDGLKIAYC